MNEVFELAYFGGGGFTYTEVWNMDVPKRRYNLKKIQDHLEKVEEAKNKNRTITEKSDPKAFSIPDFVKQNYKEEQPSFVSKVKSKK